MAVSPGPPGIDDFEQGFAFRQRVEHIVDQKLEPYGKPRPPRVFTENIPFGVPGAPAFSLPAYLFPLRITFPARVVGWELWVPSGSATIDIQLVRQSAPLATPASIVGGVHPTATNNWVESNDVSTWTLMGVNNDELVGDELLIFYLIAPTTAVYGHFGISLRDLTVTT